MHTATILAFPLFLVLNFQFLKAMLQAPSVIMAGHLFHWNVDSDLCEWHHWCQFFGFNDLPVCVCARARARCGTCLAKSWHHWDSPHGCVGDVTWQGITPHSVKVTSIQYSWLADQNSKCWQMLVKFPQYHIKFHANLLSSSWVLYR
jgi:hypothetical protein